MQELGIFTNCPHCLQSKGPIDVRARAEALTDPVELSCESQQVKEREYFKVLCVPAVGS